MLNPKCIYINGTKVVGNSKGSSGPLLRRVEKRMPKVRVGEDQGVRSTALDHVCGRKIRFLFNFWSNTILGSLSYLAMSILVWSKVGTTCDYG